jgi:hypothetical protein
MRNPRSRFSIFVVGAALLALAIGLGALSPQGGERRPLDDGSPTACAPERSEREPTLAGRPEGRLQPAAPVVAWPADGAEGREPVALADEAAYEEEDEDAHLVDGLPLTVDHPRVAPVVRVQRQVTPDLFRHPLVVGTAVGRDEAGEIALVVLASAPISDLPSRIGGVPVLVHVSGELHASRKGADAAKGKPGGGAQVDPTTRFARPVPIGVSTGHPSITAGTIGCRVSGGGLLYALSNNHVYADENLALVGDAVIQPGTFDGGQSPADDIGVLSAFVEIDFRTIAQGGANEMDAAIAQCDAGDLGNATPSDGYGRPRSTTHPPAIGLRVTKYGRTTRTTSGKVFAINASVNVGYSTGTAGFVGQVVVTPGSFSAGGDSGSLIVAKSGGDARKPVALLFAGGSNATIGSPIDPILQHFDVVVDGD